MNSPQNNNEEKVKVSVLGIEIEFPQSLLLRTPSLLIICIFALIFTSLDGGDVVKELLPDSWASETKKENISQKLFDQTYEPIFKLLAKYGNVEDLTSENDLEVLHIKLQVNTLLDTSEMIEVEDLSKLQQVVHYSHLGMLYMIKADEEQSSVLINKSLERVNTALSMLEETEGFSESDLTYIRESNLKQNIIVNRIAIRGLHAHLSNDPITQTNAKTEGKDSACKQAKVYSFKHKDVINAYGCDNL